MNQELPNIRIMIADDHRFFRSGVRSMLETVPGFAVIEETTSGDETVQRAKEIKPDVILMDLQMPGLNGIEATRQVMKDSPQTGIIIVTMFEDTDSVIAAMRAGARGYILKDADEEEMVRSIRAVKNGEALFGPAVAKRLMSFLTDVAPGVAQAAFPELTDREREVLTQMAFNKTNETIADETGLSLKTVRNHVSSILAKLQVADRHEAVARAKSAGLGKG
jgi:DNA-binding NarL/FixJ family response regulator